MAYSKPDPCAGTLTTIVPVGTAQVGCIVVEAVGAAGAVGAALIAMPVTADTQVISVVLLVVKLCVVFGESPAKVTDTW